MISIVKYNGGNIKSIQNALNRLGYSSLVTDNPKLLLKSSKVIFPGVGEASSAMKYLRSKELDKLIPELTCPTLGICLGMQLMCSYSEEGSTHGMGIFKNQVKRFKNIKTVPHMGWNNLTEQPGTLFQNTDPTNNYYFIHSYYVEIESRPAARCNYINDFAASIEKANFFGTQFHPEKSGTAGEMILSKFLKL